MGGWDIHIEKKKMIKADSTPDRSVRLHTCTRGPWVSMVSSHQGRSTSTPTSLSWLLTEVAACKDSCFVDTYMEKCNLRPHGDTALQDLASVDQYSKHYCYL